MKKYFLFLITVLILFGSCKNKTTIIPQQTEFEQVAKFELPENAVPIIYHHSIYIPGNADSIPGNFLLDTGANLLFLDSIFYANNSFPKFKIRKGKLFGAGSDGSQDISIIEDPVSFSFKNNSNNYPQTSVTPLKLISGDIIDGLIGKDGFTNTILEINYLHEYIMLHNKLSSIDTSDYVKINMKLVKTQLLVPVTIQINDTISIQGDFILDTGCTEGTILTSSAASKYDLTNNIANKVQFYSKHIGFSGASTACFFRANSIEIGGFKLDKVTMGYSEDKSGALAQNDFIGIVGNGVLERFDVIIDFINNDLYLKPNQNYSNPFNFSKLGFDYTDRSITMNGWVVNGLYKNSNAEIAGLKIDDKIIYVNGIDIHQLPYKEQIELWKKLDRATLTILRDGEEIIIEFDLDYVGQEFIEI